MDDKRVYIMDVYNRGIYPHDGYAKRNALICLYNITSHLTLNSKMFFFINSCNMPIYSPLYSGLKKHQDFQFLILLSNIIDILDLKFFA